jgi:hypothetical protein
MKPSHSNAFREPDNSKSSKRGAKQVSIPALSSMTAVLCETDYGWSLKLSPMRAFDALRIWPSITSAPDACSLLYDVELADVNVGSRRASRLPRESSGAKTLAELADHLGIPVVEHFGSDRLVLDELALRELVGMTNTRHMKCVLVEGPVEARDAAAIADASRNGANPLLAEFRAVAAMTVDADRHITLETRTRQQAVQLVAENLRHYLAAIRDRPFDEFSSPENWQIDRLLSISGSLTIRPVETDVFSTAIDVGISTSAGNVAGKEGGSRPADRSLIYDLPSQTWHDEP